MQGDGKNTWHVGLPPFALNMFIWISRLMGRENSYFSYSAHIVIID